MVVGEGGGGGGGGGRAGRYIRKKVYLNILFAKKISRVLTVKGGNRKWVAARICANVF